MSGPQDTQHDLPREVETLLAMLMAEHRPDELAISIDRLEAALASAPFAAPEVLDELRSAIELVRGGQNCAAVSALLAARSALSMRNA